MVLKHYNIFTSLDEGVFQVHYCNTLNILNYFTIIALLYRLNSEGIILFIVEELVALPNGLAISIHAKIRDGIAQRVPRQISTAKVYRNSGEIKYGKYLYRSC